MKFEDSIASLEADGFIWDRLRDYFPFGDVSLREGNYQRLLERILALLTKPEQQSILLSLLDAQACVLLEQVWVQQEQSERIGLKPSLDGHFISAWLQINSNFRHGLRLPDRDGRGAMLKLPAGEMLADRIVQSLGRGDKEENN